MKAAAAAAASTKAAGQPPTHRRAGELTEAALLRHQRQHAPLPFVDCPKPTSADPASFGGGGGTALTQRSWIYAAEGSGRPDRDGRCGPRPA